jgi:hypothetical protein
VIRMFAVAKAARIVLKTARQLILINSKLISMAVLVRLRAP